MKARKYFEHNRLAVIVGVAMTLILVIGLATILPLAGRGGAPTTKPTPTPTTGVVTPTPATQPTPTPIPADNTPAPAAGVVLGPQACPAAVKDPAHWDAVLGNQESDRKVEGVSCANVMGNASLQALVTVRYSNANGTLDVYVFNNITSAKPTQIFKLQGLLKGAAKISGYNTVMTAEVDQNSSANAGKPSSQWTVELFRGFEWNSGKGTLVQVAFPGIFPDLTRYQAEADQALVNQGKETWKNDPKQVAQRLAVKFFKWAPNAPTSILSGGGPKDVNATVQVKSTFFGGSAIHVKLSRLEGNTANMWVAIGVEDANGLLTITTPRASDRLTNPITIKGTGSAFEGEIGQAFVLDHLYDVIGNARVSGAGMGKTTYTTTVNYHSTFKQGVQEGVVAIYDYSQADGSIATAVMVKVLLS
jgi:hypothetical protein